MAAKRGVTRVLEKLEVSVNSGQYYEAHQMYRTLYFRYITFIMVRFYVVIKLFLTDVI